MIDVGMATPRCHLLDAAALLDQAGDPLPERLWTGLLLARADGDHQVSVVGQQFAGRVGLFLRVDDFDVSYERMIAAGVRFVSPPRIEAYGTVAVFIDLEGNRRDLLGPDPKAEETG